MKERQQEVEEKDPVQFQEFNKNHGAFVPLSKEDRVSKEQKHAEELQVLQDKEWEEKREMDRLMKEK